jgi:hypothetical protein
MSKYFVTKSRSDAESLIQKINEIKNFSTTWDEPTIHPLDDRCLVRCDLSQLQGCESLLSDYEVINKDEAIKRGWYLGPFTGALAREKEKMEDIHCLFEAMTLAYGKPNFPAFRALLLSFLSACYSLKESLKKKSQTFPAGCELAEWWKERAKEIAKREGELLQSYEQYMNTEKHGGAVAGQVAPLSIHSQALFSNLYVIALPTNAAMQTMQITEQGAFVTVDLGTYMERRVPVGIQDAKYEVVVGSPPVQHLGQSIVGLPFILQMSLIRDYYANLLFSAKTLIEGQGQCVPAIFFKDGASLSVEQ